MTMACRRIFLLVAAYACCAQAVTTPHVEVNFTGVGAAGLTSASVGSVLLARATAACELSPCALTASDVHVLSLTSAPAVLSLIHI